MSFQSYSFFVFLAVTLAVVLFLARRGPRWAVPALGLASLVSYAAGAGIPGLFVLLGGTAVSGLAVRWSCAPGRSSKERKRILLLAAGYQILVLLVFKYTGFLTGGAVTVGWIPLGLSFFTFQQLWMLKETWSGNFRPASWRELVLFSFFFPTVTSGPILKAGDFFSQLRGEHFLHPTWQDAAAGLYAIAVGTMKKVLLADAFGVIVNNGWSRLGELTAPGAWLVILGYTFQLYFDFSGYCDIAAGLGRLLGLRLPQNFNSPYQSRSVGEFWKRWHITLTSFLRECLYFPLGGSRKGAARAYLNIMIVFLVSGFWHGAGWTFLIWGGLHGLAQIAERALGSRRERLPGWVRWGMTFLFVNLAWVFFRAPDVAGALVLLRTAVLGGFASPEAWLLTGLYAKETAAVELILPALKPWSSILRVLLLYGAGALATAMPKNTIQKMEDFRPAAWKAVLLALGVAWSVLSFGGISTFIYSNF